MTLDYALIDSDGKIIDLLVFESEDIELANQILQSSNAVNGKFCSNKTAMVNGYYINEMFYPIKQYNSWIPSPDKPEWVPPIAKPDSGFWKWDEETLSWQELALPINE